ncbi:MAG: Ig-like domain-containing protein [Atribacterota bacterium]|nr:Ig-like domain-containing protein [Atribacterota bacterium]
MKNKKHILLVTILILLIFLVTGCSGFLPKPTKGVISGRVLIPPTAKQLSKDISGWVGAAGAEVTIVDANGVKHTIITDENGYYNFENIAVKANTVVTATVKVDGKTLVLKGVIPQGVAEDEDSNAGTMTPESTALALVVEKLIAEGKEQSDIDLEEIKGTDSFAALVEQVETVIEEQGNVTENPDVTGGVEDTAEEIITPPAPPATPPSGPSAVPVSSVSIDQEDQTLVIGATLELTATIEPANATNKNVTWETSAEDVATVDNDGVVTAVGDGEAAITVTTASGNKADTITITVSKVYNQTQKTPHNTIQGAIDEAEDHDTILVGASPYAQEDDLTIPKDVTLNLYPGVIIKFGLNNNLVVNGTLLAEGTDSEPITFTSDNKEPGKWGKISFGTTANNSKIDHCVIEYATVGVSVVWDSIETEKSSPVSVTNSTLRYISHRGVQFCGMHSSFGFPYQYHPVVGIEVTGNSFLNVGKGATDNPMAIFTRSVKDVMIADNTIEGGEGTYLAYLGVAFENYVFENNIITDPGYNDGIYDITTCGVP